MRELCRALDVFCFLSALEVTVAAIFCFALGGALHLVDFAEGRGNVCALEADLVVCLAVDVADEEVDAGVVAVFGESEHVVEATGACE